jgi:hypothetical protein
VQDLAIDFEEIRRDVPYYTDQLLNEIADGGNQQQIKNLVLQRVYEILDMDAARQDQAVRNHFFSKYDCSSFEECGDIINGRLIPLQAKIDSRTPIYLGCGLFVLLMFLFGGKKNGTRLNMLALLLLAATFLIGGVFYPMLSIDARVTEFNFEILSMKVAFGEQVLFYQSKSIIDVTMLLLQSDGIMTIGVGVMILVFSLIFPITKMGLSLLIKKGYNGKAILDLTTKASKWSMADVFVIAIFMAFIGINGVIDSQISGLESNNPFVDLVATNNTVLETGFVLFSMFCLVSMVLGKVVQHYAEEV